MINVLIAYDDTDDKLGGYFCRCKDHLTVTLQGEIEDGRLLTSHEIAGVNCRLGYIEITHESLKEKPFIMVVYSHGVEDAVVSHGTAFIKAGNDNSFYQDSFFYTNSCLSGKKLGRDLITQNCKAFIGYEQSVFAFKEENENISINCDNLGLTAFLTTDITAFDAYTQMKNYLTDKSKDLLKFGDILTSGMLISTREALFFDGDRTLKKEHLSADIKK